MGWRFNRYMCICLCVDSLFAFIPGYTYSEERVVVAGNVVTSRGPGTAFEFALKLVELLMGAEKATEIQPPMMLK